MKFPLYFSGKIARSKDNKNNLSRIIIFIGRLSVTLGIIVSLITVATGLGAKKNIKGRVSDFGGHVSIKSTKSNSSYNSSTLNQESINIEKLKELNNVETLQSYASFSGILRNEKDFAGIIFKGVGKDFDAHRFEKFLIKGKVPVFDEKGYNNQIILSKKIATELNLDVKDSIVAVFSKEDQKPIYRKFEIEGIYNTDINIIDDIYVIGDINHVRKIQNLSQNDIGGLEVFLKDSDKINQDISQIEKTIGYNNFAESLANKYPKINDFIKIFDTNIALIITIMLVVVIINIVMVLLILIIERTNSIGILKTLGANNAQIQSIFINYTLIIMIPGLFLGNIIGIGLLLLQKYFGIIKLNPENYFINVVPVDINFLYIAAISLGILVVSAVVMILPSYLISRISPVKVVNYN